MNTGQTTPLRVLIADDCPEVRSAIRLLLENQNGEWKITGEAEDVNGLRKAIATQNADLILLDWELPGLQLLSQENFSVRDLVNSLKSSGIPLFVVAFSGFFEARQQAKAAGVDAFVSKIEPPENFLNILKSVEQLSGA